MIDTHAHLYLEEFDNDRQVVIDKSVQAGVSKMLAPGIDENTSKNACELSKANPGIIYSAVGIHPNYSNNYDGYSLDHLFSEYPGQIVAVGEIGLDFYRNYASKQSQINTFEKNAFYSRIP